MMANDTHDATPPPKRRRILAQTMGHQLREAGLDQGVRPMEDPQGAGNSIRGFNFIRSVYGGLASDRREQAPIQTPESDVVPGEDDQLPAGGTKSSCRFLWQPGEVLSGQESARVSFDDLIDWTQSYFDNWHPAYPFIHAPSMVEYFEHIAQNDQFATPETPMSYQMIILKALMSISLADRRQTGTTMAPPPVHLVFTSFNDAIRSASGALSDETSILSLQAVVSVQLFLLSMLRYNAASRLQGLSIRMTVQLGLHRCPIRVSEFSESECGLRKRLFLSIYCIDRYICARLGLPLGIQDGDIDVCYPGSETHTGNINRSTDRDNRLNLIAFLGCQAEIRGCITELRNRHHRNAHSDTDRVTINTKLTKWWNEVEEYLDSGSSMNRFHQMTLVVLRHESVIALNRSVLASSKTAISYNEALQNCICAAREVLNTLYRNLTTSSPESTPETTPLLWPSFTWAVWMSAFIMIHAASEDQVAEASAIRFADRSLEILKHLAIRGSIWPNACTVAIRNLRDQLKARNMKSSQSSGSAQTSTFPAVEDRTPQGHRMGSQDRRSDAQSRQATPNQPMMRGRAPQHANTHSFANHIQQHGTRNYVDSFPNSNIASLPQNRIIPPSRSVSRSAAEDVASGGPNSNSRQSDAFPDHHLVPDLQRENITGPGQPHTETMPIFHDGRMDLFYGSDIPFWMGDDQLGILGEDNWI